MTQTLSFPVPSALGSLDAYISSANRFPLLTEAEEKDFAHRFREEGDVDAARALVLSHLRLVIAVARGYLGYGLPHADLIQEGNVGLMKPMKRFDSSLPRTRYDLALEVSWIITFQNQTDWEE